MRCFIGFGSRQQVAISWRNEAVVVVCTVFPVWPLLFRLVNWAIFHFSGACWVLLMASCCHYLLQKTGVKFSPHQYALAPWGATSRVWGMRMRPAPPVLCQLGRSLQKVSAAPLTRLEAWMAAETLAAERVSSQSLPVTVSTLQPASAHSLRAARWTGEHTKEAPAHLFLQTQSQISGPVWEATDTLKMAFS